MASIASQLWRTARYLYPIALFVLVWAAVAQAALIRPLFLPSPQAVVVQFVELWEEGEIVKPLLLSVYRAFAGLALAAALGVTTGLLLQRSRLLHWAVEPLVAVGFPAPKIAFMPIFVLWFGIDDLSKILLVAFTCVFPIIVATYHGATTVPRNFIWSAQAMGTSEIMLLRNIILPASLGHIFSGVRVAVPVALITAYTAEMIAGGGGLGAALMYAQRMFLTPTVFVYIVLMLLSGILFDQVLLALRRKTLPWMEEHTG
jgi:ABC-type nitrate/sulfonate/bicarbonate transport system permease component